MKRTRIMQLASVAAASVLVGYMVVISAWQGNQQPHSLDFPPVMTADAAAVDYFLKIDGIEGESFDDRHKGEIDVMSFSWGMSNSGTFASSGGSGAGKVSFGSIRLNTAVSKASPMIFESVATGKHFPNVTLSAVRTGAIGEEFLIITLTDVMITSFQTGGMVGEVPTDTFRLNYAKIEFEYKPQKADGSLDAPVKAGYDLKANKKV
jgi:type VI secretion system secreted protein Hcp